MKTISILTIRRVEIEDTEDSATATGREVLRMEIPEVADPSKLLVSILQLIAAQTPVA